MTLLGGVIIGQEELPPSNTIMLLLMSSIEKISGPLVDKFLEVGVVVFEAFSLHGGIDGDKQDQKQGQVSGQQRHT